MTGNSSLRGELQNFGFSDKEIDTYIALLRIGESKASEIASEAGVSKRYIYDVMERFEERNFVDINNYSKPTTIKPLEPAEVVDYLDGRLESLQSNLEAEYTEPNRGGEDSLNVIKSEQTVQKHLSILVQNAETDLMISIPNEYLDFISPDLRNAVDRGVFVLLLVHNTSNSVEDLHDLGTVVRLWDKRGPLLVMADYRHNLFRPNQLAKPMVHTDNNRTVYSSDGYFYSFINSAFFTYGWNLAEEAHIGSPRELPQMYDNFRHALFDALMYHRRGETVIAELSVRPTRSDDPFETITGEIVDIKQGFIKPGNSTIPIQQSLMVNSDGQTFAVAEIGSFLEDYETESITLSLKREH